MLSNIEWHDPWWLALLPLLLVIGYLRYRGKSKYHTYMSMSNVDGLDAIRTWKTALAKVLPTLLYLSIISLVIALARPQAVLDQEEVKADGIDIAIALDLSSSMLARDFKPDRLNAAKQVAIDFINKRPYDRVGLVVFAGEAFTQCPVTTDHAMLKDMISQLGVGNLEDGTAIGMGIATAVNRLKDSNSKSKIIILMTDGENNSGYIDPTTAAELASEFDVKLYSIGIGTNGKALGPISRNYEGEYIFGPVQVKIDEQLLKSISTATGGQYYRALDQASLLRIYEEIDRLEKTEIEVLVYKKYRELLRWFLSVGLNLFFVYFVLKYFILKVKT